MGGASRNEKKRRQEAANARLAAAGIRTPQQKKTGVSPATVIAIVVVVLVAVIGGSVWYISQGLTADVEPTYTATSSGAVVTAGTGPVEIDVYEDYLCPQCERFEERYGNELTTALNTGQVTVRFHGVAILDHLTNPVGYSTRAANAALCAVPAGIFAQFHNKLFDSQPAENSSGLTDEQLIAFGTELGATGDFAGCVSGATNADAITAETNAVAVDPSLQTNGTFGTPTVTVGGAKVDLNDTAWLRNAIAAG